MRDRILADTALRCPGGDVFARRYLLDPKTGNPLPTYERRRYRGGFGYALPVFVYLGRIFWNFRKVFLYSHSQRQIGFFDEAVTAMSPQFSSVGEEIS